MQITSSLSAGFVPLFGQSRILSCYGRGGHPALGMDHFHKRWFPILVTIHMLTLLCSLLSLLLQRERERERESHREREDGLSRSGMTTVSLSVSAHIC